MGRKKYTPAQWDRFYQGLAAGETTRNAADTAGINRNTACRAGAEWRKEPGAVSADADATSGIPVSAEPTSPSSQTESAMIGPEACAAVLARAESVDGRGLERIAAALETIGRSLTALVARLSVSEPSTAQGEPAEPAVAPVQSAHRDNGTGAVSAKSPRSALQEASSRQNGIGAVSPIGALMAQGGILWIHVQR